MSDDDKTGDEDALQHLASIMRIKQIADQIVGQSLEALRTNEGSIDLANNLTTEWFETSVRHDSPRYIILAAMSSLLASIANSMVTIDLQNKGQAAPGDSIIHAVAQLASHFYARKSTESLNNIVEANPARAN